MFNSNALLNKRTFVVRWGNSEEDVLTMNTAIAPSYRFSGGLNGAMGGSWSPIGSPMGRTLLQQLTGISGYLDIRKSMMYGGPDYLNYDGIQCYIPLTGKTWSDDVNGKALLRLLKFILPVREAPVFAKISESTKGWAEGSQTSFMKNFWNTVSTWTSKDSLVYKTVGEIYGLDIPKQFLINNQIDITWYGQEFKRVFISQLDIKFPDNMSFVDANGNLVPQYITVNIGFSSSRVTAMNSDGKPPYLNWLGSSWEPSQSEDSLDSPLSEREGITTSGNKAK